MTDSEINEAVAKKLGVDLCHHTTRCPGSEPKDYCHSIAAAWEIVEYCKKRDDNFYLDWEDEPPFGIWTCQLGISTENKAENAPMVICLAFLKLNPEQKTEK